MKLGTKIKALHNKIADKGANFLARRSQKIGFDIARGKAADKKREALIRRRESRANDKARGL